MAARIRLTRVGATKQPAYRVVVADSRSPRDGRTIEILGHYNPRTEPVDFAVDVEKTKSWLAKGALPSDTVARLLRNAGVLPAAKEEGVLMAAPQLIEFVAKSLVDHPDQVEVVVSQEGGATIIELRVAEDDMGKVIGRNGSVAKALRTLLKVVGARDGEQVQLEIV
jgi:small subunit ribosomal protein S16